jgi:hypothetical protein
LARQELKGLARSFFDRHLRDQRSSPGPGQSTASNGELSGRDPLKLLITPRFSRQQLNQADPGFKQFP